MCTRSILGAAMAASRPVPAPHQEPIDRLLAPVERFLHVQAASGIVLLLATVAALALANSPWAEGFLGLWKTQVGFQIGEFRMVHSLKHWINDGLMAVFFFVVGLEVKREVVLGELRELRAAVLPFFMALGGMVVPAGIYLSLQGGTEAASGWGTPMATDIAFVVGCLALLGSRIPKSLRVLLLSLAVLDDLGAILVIAIGYTENLRLGALAVALGGIGLVLLARALGVRSLLVYTLLGSMTWLAMHESGVHATLAGVALGLITPSHAYARSGTFNRAGRRVGQLLAGAGSTHLDADEVRQLRWIARESVSPLEFLEKTLHPWVAFLVMPLFALANAGVPLRLDALVDPVAVAIAAGLFVGKPLGIVGFALLAIALRLARLPDGITLRVLLGGGCLAGIGFTMALFLSSLSLPEAYQDAGKLGVLVGSLASALCGMGLLIAPRRQTAA